MTHAKHWMFYEKYIWDFLKQNLKFSWNVDWHRDVKWASDDRLISPDTISQGTTSMFISKENIEKLAALYQISRLTK